MRNIGHKTSRNLNESTGVFLIQKDNFNGL